MKWMAVAAALVAACTGRVTSSEPHVEDMGDEHADDGHDDGHADGEVPPQYADLENPLVGDPEAPEAGRSVYATHCSACHGDQARGDGPGGESLDPAPPDLSGHAVTASDGYLFWRIREGGVAPFDSAMPAFAEDRLPTENVWQLVSYIRTLGAPAPLPDGDDDGHADGDAH